VRSGIANLYEGPSREVAIGHLEAVWRDLGRQLQTRAVGMRRMEIREGRFSTPAHEHGAEEEIFYVLAGEGLLWLDGQTFPVRSGDCIVHAPRGGAHTLRAGSGGLDVLVFGQRNDPRLTALPRASVAWSFPRWVELGQGDSPFAREAAAGPPECPEPRAERPANVVALEDVPAILDGRARRLGHAAGALASGLNHVVLAPGGGAAPAHCHSLEEEIFTVLDGGGTLELFPRGSQTASEIELARGDVVYSPAASGVAHAFRAGAEGMTYLAYGTREPADMCFYPQLGRVSLRGLGIALTSPEIEPLAEL
jgi:uncharacterized cupin superfamily protein